MNRRIKTILPCLVLCALAAAPDMTAQTNTGKQKLTLPWARKKEAERMAREKDELIDSLLNVIEEYRLELEEESDRNRLLEELAQGNSRKTGAGLYPEEYTLETSDSLLDLWYVQDLARRNHEGEGYDLETVNFASNVPDSVYKARLEKMNSFITLPYNQTVRNNIILYSEKMPTKMSQMLSLASYYMPIFEETFSRYGLPEELKYMAVIESALNPTALSRAGAAGIWQFMHQTGKSYGLHIDSFVDERYDVVKASDAAARYLRDAYDIFGDWPLAISSYNCGAGNVNKAIRRSGSREFWDVYEYLPRETRGYVPAFVGAMYAFRYHREHGIQSAPAALPAHVDTFEVHRMLHFDQISAIVGVPVATLKELNPQYLHGIIPGKERPSVLLLPYQYSARFIEHEDSVYAHRASELFSPAVLDNIKNYGSASSERIVYRVKKGDYLGKIASRYHVSVNNIKKWNNLRSNNLSIGQKLVIYQKGSSKPATPVTAKTAETVTPKPVETVTQKPAEGQTSANTGQEAADSSMVNGQAEVAAPDSLKVSDTDSVTDVADGESVKGGNETSDGQGDDSSRRTAAENGGNREADAGDAGVDSSAADSSKAKDAAKQADESAGKDSSAQASTAGKEAAEAVIYVVKKGDTLYGIAAKYPGVSAKNIMDYNGIGSNIRPGMKLRIPVRSR